MRSQRPQVLCCRFWGLALRVWGQERLPSAMPHSQCRPAFPSVVGPVWAGRVLKASGALLRARAPLCRAGQWGARLQAEFAVTCPPPLAAFIMPLSGY